MNTTTIEIFALVDEAGDYVASHDRDTLAELYTDQIDDPLPLGTRVIKIKLTVPLPSQIELAGTVPAQEPAPVLTVQ